MSLRSILVGLVLLLLFNSCRDQNAEQIDLQTTFRQYAEELPEYNIAPLQLSYMANLDSIREPEQLVKQREFFDYYKDRLQTFRLRDLEGQERYDYQLLNFEIDLHLERIALEEHFLEMHEGKPIPQGGLAKVKLGQQWYQHFLKRWLNTDVSPEVLYRLGKQEIARAQSEIRRIQQQLGYAYDSTGFYQFLNADSFFITDQAVLQQTFEARKAIVQQNLDKLFPSPASPALILPRAPMMPLPAPPAIIPAKILLFITTSLINRTTAARSTGSTCMRLCLATITRFRWLNNTWIVLLPFAKR